MKNLILILVIFLSSIGFSQVSSNLAITEFGLNSSDTLTKDNYNVEYLEKLVFERINKYRIDNGYDSLVNDSVIYIGCKAYSKFMLDNNSYEHAESTNGTIECIIAFSVYDIFGYVTYKKLSNLIVRAWIVSPMHNAALLYENSKIASVGISCDGYSLYSTYRIDYNY